VTFSVVFLRYVTFNVTGHVLHHVAKPIQTNLKQLYSLIGLHDHFFHTEEFALNGAFLKKFTLSSCFL